MIIDTMIMFLIFGGFQMLRLTGATPLVIIMLDGFRWDYTQKLSPAHLPGFNRIFQEGVKTSYVQPIFPSVSVPSWTTISTGLYAESHGMVGNDIYDPDLDLFFSLDSMDEPLFWQQQIPLWTSATNESRRVSVLHWSRCDIAIGDFALPEKCRPFNGYTHDVFELKRALDEALHDVMSGFDLIMVYNFALDEIGHKKQTHSRELINTLLLIDRYLSQFMADLEQERMLDQTNVIVVSDHGMSDNSDRITENMFDYIDPFRVDLLMEVSAFSQLLLEDGTQANRVVDEVKAWQGVRAYAKADIPDKLHFRENKRILDVLLISNGSVLIDNEPAHPDKNKRGAHHGYDDTSPDPDGYSEGNFPDMRTIFFARGPNFKSNYSHTWIKLVDEYQIFVHLLGIKGEGHNGTWSRVEDMLVLDKETNRDQYDNNDVKEEGVLKWIMAKIKRLLEI